MTIAFHLTLLTIQANDKICNPRCYHLRRISAALLHCNLNPVKWSDQKGFDKPHTLFNPIIHYKLNCDVIIHVFTRSHFKLFEPLFHRVALENYYLFQNNRRAKLRLLVLLQNLVYFTKWYHCIFLYSKSPFCKV